MAKTALILGGTKGLGLSLSWEAFNRGVQPIITGRSIYEGETRKSFPPNANYFVLDLCRSETIDRTVGHMTRYYKYPVDYIFWVAGVFIRKPFTDTSPYNFEQMISTHLLGPLRFLENIHRLAINRGNPYHLVTIASTSSWRIRENEALYCALKAAKAAFTRNFTRELIRDLPGSKVTLVNPGGMKTPNFWQESGQDISKFMDPDIVAKIIWDEVQNQEVPFKEVQIMRNDNGSPNVSYGPRMSELPFQELT